MKPLLVSFVLLITLFAQEAPEVPDLVMPENKLAFKTIADYRDYRIVATHYRTDKNELRYILANPIAFKAMQEDKKVMPEGSIVVKIGWSVKKMETFPTALEADKLQRIEYMLKDSSRFNAEGDHWGYARFVKKGKEFVVWNQGVKGCIACHASVRSNDFLFTRKQSLFQ